MSASLLWVNALSNALGQFLYPVLSVVLVPFYIRYLGLEGYGLVGFLSLLITVLGVFTKGLGSALQREFSRHDDTHGSAEPLRILYTFELVYLTVGLALGSLVLVSAGWLSHDWLRIDAIERSTVEWCLWLVGFRLMLAFPSSVYQAAFIGRQRHLRFNALSAVVSVLAAVAGVIAVLRWRSVVGLYASDLAVHVCALWWMRRQAIGVLPVADAGEDVSFDLGQVRRLARISTGLVWTNGIGLLLTQLDRVFISRLLPIAALGIYATGVAGGRLLGMCYLPFLTAVYPQTCGLAREGRTAALGDHLLRNVRVVATITLACGLTVAWFPAEILEIWTRNTEVVRDGGTVMTLYVIANLCLAQAAPLWQTQIALGDTQQGVIFNTLAVLWFPPVLWYLTQMHGLNGAAAAWVMYCALAWVYHIWATSSLMVQTRWLQRYVSLLAGSTVIGIGITAAARYLADACCAGTLWGRIAIAVGSGLMTLATVLVTTGSVALPRRLSAPVQ